MNAKTKKRIKTFPFLTLFIGLLGVSFGVTDFTKNNDLIYLAMALSGQEPTVPATYWAWGGWKAGLLGATFFLALPYVCVGLALIYVAWKGVRIYSLRDAVIMFAGGACLFSGMWDLTFLALILNYWSGELIGSEVAWLPLWVNPDGSVGGITFSYGFGVWFIVIRILTGLALLLPFEIFPRIKRRWRKVGLAAE